MTTVSSSKNSNRQNDDSAIAVPSASTMTSRCEGTTTSSSDLDQSDNAAQTTTSTTTVQPVVVELRQKLMVADEVYLYKIPPLQSSGGHRAEHWNLASPIATCSLLVERRNDYLILEFQQQTPVQEKDEASSSTNSSSNSTKTIFAQAVIDCSVPTMVTSELSTRSSGIPSSGSCITVSSQQHQQQPSQQQPQRPKTIQHWIEGTMDSSRYFTLRITQSGTGGREAMIGFGFRDRDTAIDLRESLQHYEASMRREYEASRMQMFDNNNNNNNNSDANDTACTTEMSSKYTIPKLADGERIHIRTGKTSSRDGNEPTHKSKMRSDDNNKTTTKHILLLKKPPPSAVASFTSHDDDIVPQQLSTTLDNHCNIITKNTIIAVNKTQSKNDAKGALVVHEPKIIDDDDDDDDWDTEFVSAS